MKLYAYVAYLILLIELTHYFISFFRFSLKSFYSMLQSQEFKTMHEWSNKSINLTFSVSAYPKLRLFFVPSTDNHFCSIID